MQPRFVWALWCTSAACLAAIWIAFVYPERRVLVSLGNQTRALYERANESDEILAREPRLREERRSFEREIRQLAGMDSGIGPLLEILGRNGRALGVRVVAIAPAGSSSGPGTSNGLRSERFTVDVEGTFTKILRILDGLADASSLIGVDAMNIDVSDNRAERVPLLRARINIDLYSLSPGWEKGSFRETPRVDPKR